YDETPIGSMTIMVDEAGEEEVRGLFQGLNSQLEAIDVKCRERSNAELKPYVTGHASFPAAPPPKGCKDL
ncbi:MAG TPA: hypothetical protein VFI03_13135, partial [Solirubrobacterales bacterium]|nr:hypothetical protein [Solirubrobacterales bacterium]